MSIAAGAWHTRVREHECDPLGHVNNAWYLAYLQQATVELWGSEAPVYWQLQSLALEYLTPALEGDELAVYGWPIEREGEALRCGYEVQRRDDGQPLARGLALWVWLDRCTRQPLSPAEIERAQPPAGCAPPRPLRLAADTLAGQVFRWRHTVRHHEAGPSGQVRPLEILHWVEEAKFVACSTVGWPLERMLAENCLIVQVRHDSEFLAPLAPGDEIEIHSRVCDLGRVRGAWHQEVRCRGELAATDYSTGAFLDRTGRPHPPPQAMLDALIGRER